MKRNILIITMMIIFLCTGCGNRNAHELPDFSQEEENFGADLRGQGGARIFSKETLLLPDTGVFIIKAVKLSDGNIFMYGEDNSHSVYFYFLDVSTNTLEKISLSISADIVDIDSAPNNELALLLSDAEGKYHVEYVSANGEQREIMLKDLPDKEIVLWNICACENGFLLSTYQSVWSFHSDGEFSSEIESYAGAIQFCKDENNRASIIFSDSTQGGAKIQIIDDNLKVSDTYQLNSNYDFFFSGFRGGLFGYSSKTIYFIDIASGERSGYVNTFASGGGWDNFIYLNDNLFFSLYGGAPQMWTPSDGEEVQTLKLATYNIDSDLSMAVRRFNESSTEYKIDLIDYSAYDVAGKENVGLSQLNMDIISGNLPDIYDLHILPARMYAAKGFLQDLEPFFENDDEISIESLVPSVVETLRYRGKLYELVPVFRISIMYGDSDVTGKGSKWTLDDFIKLTDEYSSQELFGNEMTKDKFIQWVLIYNFEKYMNTEKATCDFNDGSFEKILAFSATLPDESMSGNSQRWGRAYIGKQYLITESLGENYISDLLIDNELYHGRTNYIGFPDDDGSGVAMSPIMRLGMSSSSKCQDGVWAFFKFLLSEQYQTEMMRFGDQILEGTFMLPGIPVLNSALEKRLDFWMKKRAEDHALLSTYADGMNLLIDGGTADTETRQLAMALINRINCIAVPEENVYAIIKDAASAYYAGDRTIDDAIKDIQSRVEIYISEQYG